jgi:hypothetical protein
MANLRPPVRATVKVTGCTDRHATIAAAFIAWALERAGAPNVILDGVDVSEFSPTAWNPVVMGDIELRISVATDPTID